jgi:hypothetical protein
MQVSSHRDELSARHKQHLLFKLGDREFVMPVLGAWYVTAFPLERNMDIDAE